MTRPTIDDIPTFDAHGDAEALRVYDHPSDSLRGWDAVLTAKAWVGPDLACFFTDAEGNGRQIVLVFKSSKDYRPMFDGPDMRVAVVGSRYELDVFVAAHHSPIIDRVRPARQFT